MSNTSLVEMTVVKVSPYLREDRPLVWLGEKEGELPRLLPIPIGEFEAAAIRMRLENDGPVSARFPTTCSRLWSTAWR